MPILRSPLAVRALKVALMNTFIALILRQVSTVTLGVVFVQSQCVGLSIWAAFEALRKLGGDLTDEEHAPSPVRVAAVLPLGVLAGYTVGSYLGYLLTGQATWDVWSRSPRTAWAMLLMTVAASTVALGYFVAHEKLMKTRARATHAQRQAAEAQLRMLQAQLEPHMLFNTLANLRALIALDAPRAQAMLDRLIAYLRATLAASRSTLHPLHAEFARLADYLALMQVRMGPRLQVSLHLPEDLADLSVPPLLLQPLVENAIAHGLEPSLDGGRLSVLAQRHGTLLELEVTDTGVGLEQAAPTSPTEAREGRGFGLTQVRQRLATLYGPEAQLSLEPGPGGVGTVARIRLPATNAASPLSIHGLQ